MANPNEKKKKTNNNTNKSRVSNIGGAMSSPTPETDAMKMKSLREPLEAFNNAKKPIDMQENSVLKKYARGGGTRPVRR